MRNIAIVEDEDGAAELLASYIRKYAASAGDGVQHSPLCKRRGISFDYRAVYAVVFMDIQMPGMNGMDAAAELRDRDKTVSLIFITNLVQFAQKGVRGGRGQLSRDYTYIYF